MVEKDYKLYGTKVLNLKTDIAQLHGEQPITTQMSYHLLEQTKKKTVSKTIYNGLPSKHNSSVKSLLLTLNSSHHHSNKNNSRKKSKKI